MKWHEMKELSDIERGLERMIADELELQQAAYRAGLRDYEDDPSNWTPPTPPDAESVVEGLCHIGLAELLEVMATRVAQFHIDEDAAMRADDAARDAEIRAGLRVVR